MVKALSITAHGDVHLVDVTTLQDMYRHTDGGPIDVVALPFGDLWVNDEFLLRNDDDGFNSIATDVAGLGGRVDLLFGGILGDCLLTGPVSANGDKTDVTDDGMRIVRRVAREAGRQVVVT